MWVFVVPRTDNALNRRANVFDQVRYRIAVSVVPTAYRKNSSIDCAIVFANRTMFPIIITVLVAEPFGN